MVLTIQALDAQARKSAQRRVMVSSVVVAAAVAMSVSWSNTPEQTVAAPVVSVQEHRQTERELTQLRQLFTYCKTAVHWSDTRCQNPTESRAGTLAVTNPVRVIRESDDGDDSDDGDNSRTVVVQQARPSTSSSRGSQRPSTKTKSDRSRTKPGAAGSGNRGRHGGTGHGTVGRGGK